MGRYQKYLIKILICFCIVYTPFFANAGAAEKWDLVENHYDDIGKRMSYTAKKVGSAVNDATYKAKVPVTAATVGSSAKMLIRGGLASAAIYGIVEGVGWIIDNGVVYKVESEEVDNNKPNAPIYFVVTGTRQYFAVEYSAVLALRAYAKSKYPAPYVLVSDVPQFFCANPYVSPSTNNSCNMGSISLVYGNGGWDTYKYEYYQSIVNPDYDPTKPLPESKKIPVSDTELGRAIIDSPAAPQVIPDIYNPNQPTKTPARDASQDKLKKAIPDSDTKGDVTNKPNKDTDGDGKPDVYDPELPEQGFDFELPAFCDWASVVCVWYEKYIDDSEKLDQHREDEKSFWETIKDWFDWTKQESETDTNLDIDSPEQTQPETNISFSTACPAKIPLHFNWNGQSLDFSFDFTIWCQAISTYVYPIVVTLGSLHALYIVTGVRQDG